MKLKTVMAALLILSAAFVQAETAQEAAIRKLVKPVFGNDVKIDSVTKTPYAGMYEVRIGSDIVYTDEKAQYLFFGEVIDAHNSTNYTKLRTDELSKIKFADLPFDAALKMVKGNGKRVFAIFEDPNCGYCKRFRKTLQGMDNITVYTFMYNILAEDSVNKSKNIWCSSDKNKAWDEWMLNGKAAPAAAANCATPNEKIAALGRRLRITGTPTIFFTDGSRLPGAVDLKVLEDKLASVK